MAFLAATNKAAMSGCPADFDTDNWNQVTLTGLAPETRVGWAAVLPHGEEGKGSHWAVALQHQGRNTNIYPKLGAFPPSQKAGSPWAIACGRSPSCVTATSLWGHTPLYTWSHWLTHVPSQRIWAGEEREGAKSWYKEDCQVDMLHYSRGLRSLSLCPKDKCIRTVHLLTWTAFTCLTEAATGCQG